MLVEIALATILKTGGHSKFVKPLSLGPLQYFRDRCMRCHGPEGAAYTEDFTKGKTSAQLRADIVRMANDAGQAPLQDPRDVDAQVAWHYAMDEKLPFLSWTSWKGQTLSGETRKGDLIQAFASGKTVPVTVKDDHWQLSLSKTQTPADIVLKVTHFTGRSHMLSHSEIVSLSKAPYLIPPTSN